MLKNATDSEFTNIVNKPMKYQDLLIELRNCGILLYPYEEDVVNVGYKIKNYDANDRAIFDIILASRCYAVKSHILNPYITNEIIIAKFKPNPDYDLYFFDDEEKDWFEVGWYFNKCVIGKTIKRDDIVEFSSSTDIVIYFNFRLDLISTF
jgi:hypothetical protein